MTESDHDCSICWETLGTNGGVLTLYCGHPFCRDCITRSQAQSDRCPICRSSQQGLAHANTAVSAVPSPAQNASQYRAAEVQESTSTAEGMPHLTEAGPNMSEMFGLSEPHASHRLQSSWTSQLSGPASIDAIRQLQSNVQTVMVCIESLEDCPPGWQAQCLELLRVNALLEAGPQGAVSDRWQVIEQVQQYTDNVTADLANFIRHSEGQQQQVQRQVQQRQQVQQQQQVQQRQHGEPAGLEAVLDLLQLFQQVLR